MLIWNTCLPRTKRSVSRYFFWVQKSSRTNPNICSLILSTWLIWMVIFWIFLFKEIHFNKLFHSDQKRITTLAFCSKEFWITKICQSTSQSIIPFIDLSSKMSRIKMFRSFQAKYGRSFWNSNAQLATWPAFSKSTRKGKKCSHNSKACLMIKRKTRSWLIVTNFLTSCHARLTSWSQWVTRTYQQVWNRRPKVSNRI